MSKPVYTISTNITFNPLPLNTAYTAPPSFKTPADATRNAALLSLTCNLVTDPSTRGPGREAAKDCFAKVADTYRNDTKLTGTVSQTPPTIQDSVNERTIGAFEKFKANQRKNQ